ncbi:MAG: ABC transporter ATP-binding protein [Clostridia bacterium]|nr:ABC transporter ATP-binding protein [Clostridia bacterium]
MRANIEIKDVSKHYGKTVVVDQLNFKIMPGEIFALLGLNGAGKTTTLKMMLGLTIPTQGEIRYFNKSFHENRNYILPRIGSVIEHPGFYDHLTVYENFKLITNIVGLHEEDSIFDLLRLVNLDFKLYDKVKTLNLQEKQKLAIARALLNNPLILLLDEPFNGLDVKSVNEMRNILMRLANERKVSIIIASHVLSEIEKIASRIAVIHHGKIIQIFDQAYLKGNSMSRTVIKADDMKLLYQRLKEAGYKEFLLKEQYIYLNEAIQLDELSQKLDLNNLNIIECYKKAITLEDYFVELVGGEMI